MTGATPGSGEADEAALMAHYGIVRVPADEYRLGEWCYSNLRDALAQARRMAATPPPQ
jgi:hypothetical protein